MVASPGRRRRNWQYGTYRNMTHIEAIRILGRAIFGQSDLMDSDFADIKAWRTKRKLPQGHTGILLQFCISENALAKIEGEELTDALDHLLQPNEGAGGMLKLDLGDSRVWMETAVILYENNAPSLGDVSWEESGYPRTNKMNVAYVCGGYAFELLFKVLVRVGGNCPSARHETSIAYAKLAAEDRKEVDKRILKHGWECPCELLSFLDKHLCHRDRKYWMRPPKGGRSHGQFHFGGIKGIESLKHLHDSLSEFALFRISETRDEDWPGMDLS